MSLPQSVRKAISLYNEFSKHVTKYQLEGCQTHSMILQDRIFQKMRLCIGIAGGERKRTRDRAKNIRQQAKETKSQNTPK